MKKVLLSLLFAATAAYAQDSRKPSSKFTTAYNAVANTTISTAAVGLALVSNIERLFLTKPEDSRIKQEVYGCAYAFSAGYATGLIPVLGQGILGLGIALSDEKINLFNVTMGLGHAAGIATLYLAAKKLF